jgi:hypothetical protein
MTSSRPPGATNDSPCALICYQGDYYSNLGDDIQALAALQFSEHVDYYIPIDEIAEFRRNASVDSPKVKAILNGWYTSNPDSWPPSPELSPLFVSFHATDHVYAGYPKPGLNTHRPAIDVLLSPSSVQYFKEHAPIGCRDLTTMTRMHDHGIDAYFSGCLTLTFKARQPEHRESICLVDIAGNTDDVVAQVPHQLRGNIRLMTHNLHQAGSYTVNERLDIARQLLDTYGSAALVITSRLHCALPCLAFGTPVIFVRPQHDLSRFPGLLELMHNCSIEDVEQGRYPIRWSSPEPNPVSIHALADDLRTRCASFLDPGE